MPRARAHSARPTASPPPAVPGDLDPLITAAAHAGRRLTDAERATVAGRHQPGTTADTRKVCRTCRFRYRRNASACPSVVYLNTGSYPTALAAIPPTIAVRTCRACRVPVTVPAGAPSGDRPLCDSCQDQPSLFADDELFGGVA
ncbi:MAG: hypothetical protein IRZ08_20800 [Frankia sp.]|nr:hypothetical protein [Frankia sp.]